MNGALAAALKRGRGVLAGFTPGQRAIVVVAALGLLLGAFYLTRWASQPTWTPLYSNLSGTDANSVVNQLNSDGVQYKLADGGQTVLVPQSKVYALRVQLSGKGLPAGNSQGGYALLDKQGITSTDFQQNIAYQRALEGELDKTLEAMSGVQQAVVHLAIPKKDVFATAQDATTASVLLSLTPGASFGNSQTRAVSRLVAGAVPGLTPDNVTLTDSNGVLLSGGGSGADAAAMQQSETDQQTAQYESRIGGNAQAMLDKVLGPGKAVVRVNAQLNFDSVDRTSENYLTSPSPFPLSQSLETESYTGNGASAGGAMGQTIPTLTASANGSGTGSYNERKSTTDYGRDKVVERSLVAPGQVQRLSVSVALDSSVSGITPAQVQAMVSGAVGLDAKRGDVVQVTQVPFDTTAAATAKKELAQQAQQAQLNSYVSLAKKVALGLLLLIVLFVAWRRRRKNRPSVEATASDLPDYANVLVSRPAPPAIEARPAPVQLALPTEEEMANRERIRAEVTRLVDNSPDEVARMLQGWLAERNS